MNPCISREAIELFTCQRQSGYAGEVWRQQNYNSINFFPGENTVDRGPAARDRTLCYLSLCARQGSEKRALGPERVLWMKG